MQVGIGGIIGGIAETGHKEQGEHHHDHTDAGRPNASDVGFADNRAPNAIEQQHNANEGHCREKGHGKIVVEVFHRREKHLLRLRINGITVFQKEAHKEGEEEREEGDGGTYEAHTGTRTEVFVVDVVDDVEGAEHACKKHYGEAEHEVPRVKQGIEACGSIGPTTDDRRTDVC